MPKGTVGHRWSQEKGKWNLKMEDGRDDTPLDPELSFLEQHDEVVQVAYHEFAEAKVARRGVPVRYVETERGRVPVTTAFDLLVAQFGVSRGLPATIPTPTTRSAPTPRPGRSSTPASAATPWPGWRASSRTTPRSPAASPW
jgi:nitrate reductase alpha subunit